MGRKREYKPPLIHVVSYNLPQEGIISLLDISLESLALKGYPPQTNGLLPIFYRVNADFTPSFSQAYAVQKEMELNLIGLHWAIKIFWNTKHKLPVSERWASPFKPLGEFFKHVYILCKECHPGSRLVGVDIKYSDAVEWFQAFFLEWLHCEVTRTLKEFDTDSNNAQANGTKRSKVRGCQAFWNKLDNYENPSIHGTHLWELLDVAILMAESSDVFRKSVFKPFVKSGRDMVNMYSHPKFLSHFSKKCGAEIGIQIGQGKATKTVKMPHT